MATWEENYVAGLRRELAAARTSGNKDSEAAVTRELANYGHEVKDEPDVKTEPDVAQTRTSPPKGRTAKPQQATTTE